MPNFADWLSSHRDSMTRIRLAKRLDRAQRGSLGDVAPVGEGVFRMRKSLRLVAQPASPAQTV